MEYEAVFGDDHICPKCRREIEEQFDRVRAYLYDHPGANIATVTAECEVTERQVLRWLREDRIFVAGNTGYILKCEGCGKPIPSGVYCPECAKRYSSAKGSGFGMNNQGAETGKQRFAVDSRKHI
ncbi:MAG: flagellar protein [Lachnospiraceae bacterium]|nr:flagellar protein [Lachnospiraceae bacterium]